MKLAKLNYAEVFISNQVIADKQKAVKQRLNEKTDIKVRKTKVNVLTDCCFLSLVVVLSVLLYQGSLGFYSDDWSILGYLSISKDQSFGGIFAASYGPSDITRPVQSLQYALLYWLFGLNPLGYHLSNALVMILIAVLFYLVLSKLGQPRILTLAIPLVFALLPNYSTDRLWYAIFSANLSLALFFLSFYADLSAILKRGSHYWSWRLLGLICLLLSSLAYEVAMLLFVFDAVLTGYYYRQQLQKLNPVAKLSWIKLASIAVPNLISVIGIMGFKYLTSNRLDSTFRFPYYFKWVGYLVVNSVKTNYIDYGLALPINVWQTLNRYNEPIVLILGATLGLIIFGYLYYISKGNSQIISFRPEWLGAVGLVVFALGYAIFLTNDRAGFSATGIANRVAIAAVVGVAIVWVAIIGRASSIKRLHKYRRSIFCGLITVICLIGFLLNNYIATFWVKAYQQEQVVVNNIRQQFPTLPTGSKILLDGVCPYIGPGIVFESSWDLVGMLMIYYHDNSLEADVVKPGLEVKEDAIHIPLYGISYRYPYNKLFIYNYAKKQAYPIPDADAANRYFQSFNPDYTNGCKHGEEGSGQPIF